jgi:hypothetical protein
VHISVSLCVSRLNNEFKYFIYSKMARRNTKIYMYINKVDEIELDPLWYNCFRLGMTENGKCSTRGLFRDTACTQAGGS